MSSKPIQTIAELFLHVAERGEEPCLMQKRAGVFEAISAAEVASRVYQLAAAFDGVGVNRGDRIALLADNGPEWPVIDFATLCSGAVLAPVYPTLTAEQAAFIIADSGARFAYIEGAERLEGLLRLRDRMPAVERFVITGDDASPADDVPTLSQFLAEHSRPDVDAFQARARAIEPSDLATFIYTSGTTGRPKGVMLSHGNIASNVAAALEVIDFKGGYTALSFLPLCHSFERTVDYCYFERGVTIAYAESVATVAADLLLVKPQVFVSVPRVYEKMLGRVQESVAQASGLRQRLFRWAVEVGKRALPDRLAVREPGGTLGLQLKIVDALVFSKIRARLGGRFRFAISGGAPLAPEVAKFFWAAGIEIYEGYGLSETSPILTVNRLGAARLGTVGPAIPGVELRIAEDGEILARGPNIMKGYWGMPDETAKVIDEEDWFHTGDIGELDEAWHLRITDRKKEIIVNAYGKNVAPAPIENALKASPFVGHAVVIGDKRKFLSALLVPDFDNIGVWARQRSIPTEDRSELVRNADVRKLFEAEVAGLNESLSRYQQIKSWDLLGDDFTIEGGELTPTQKIKRRVIRDKYKDVIDALYERADAAMSAKGDR